MSMLSSVIVFVFPFLSLTSLFVSVRTLQNEYRNLVDFYLRNSKTFALSDVSFASAHQLAEFLTRFLDLPNLEILSLCRLRVRLSEEEVSKAAEESERMLFARDLKIPVTYLPLGVLSVMRRIRHIRIASNSLKSEFFSRLLGSLSKRATHKPLQLGLANLHEIASACPKLRSLQCVHLERSKTNQVTDCFGPECTPEVLRRIRLGCPDLREIGVLSSPGPRLLCEILRLGSTFPQILETPEITETLHVSFLDEISKFQLTAVLVSMTTAGLPLASARNMVLAQISTPNSLGELNELAGISLPLSSSLIVIARSGTLRINNGRVSSSTAALLETVNLTELQEALVQNCNVSVIRIPNDRVKDVFESSEHATPFSLQLQPSLGYDATRSVSIASSQESEGVAHEAEEPDDFFSRNVFEFVNDNE